MGARARTVFVALRITRSISITRKGVDVIKVIVTHRRLIKNYKYANI